MVSIFRLLVPASVLALVFSETVLIFASYGVWAFLAPGRGNKFLLEESGWQRIAVLAAVILLAMYIRQLYGDLQIRSRILLLQQLVLIMGMAFLSEAMISYLNLNWALPRDILIPGSALAIASLFTWRIVFSMAIRNKVGLRRVLFMGLPPASVQVAHYLSGHPEIGFAPIGYLDSASIPATATEVVRLGSPAELQSVVEEHRPDCIVIGKRAQMDTRRVQDFAELRFGGVQTEEAAGFYERTLGRVCATEMRPEELIFSKRLQPDHLRLRLQSMYTWALALLAAPLLVMMMATAALVIALASRQPLLRREQHVGLHGAPFTMYWFGLDPEGANASTTPRTVRFLQRYGLHALPQIWNVLRGQMTFVGPQADRPEFAALLNQSIPIYEQRTVVRPGMTGWAQINQIKDGSRVDAMRRLEYDMYYIKNLSFLLDLFVLLRWFRETFLFHNAPET
jgi:lipopolysaccharide/colanic/teichoic acid biosynthesis glycosyltransferase